MQDNQYENFGHTLRNLSLVFPKEVSEQVIELYWHALKSYEFNRISIACEMMVKERSSSFFPNPAEIKEVINTLPQPEPRQIEQFPELSTEEKQRIREMTAFYRFEDKRYRRGIHPDDTDTWNTLIEEFQLEHNLTDKRAAELIAMRRKHGYSYLQNDPHFFGDESLYIQFGKWAVTKNKTFTLGQPEKSYLLIVKEYIRDENIRDLESMEILIKLLSTKQQGVPQ